MKKLNEIQNPKEEDMQKYLFLSVDGFHEDIEVFEVIAGCEDDAWDLINEGKTSNYSSEFLLTPKLIKSLKKVAGELK